MKMLREMTRCVTILSMPSTSIILVVLLLGLPIGLNETFLGIFPCFLLGHFSFSLRLFEEGSQPKITTTSTSTMVKTKTSVSQSAPIPQGLAFIRTWPGSHEDAGVFILSNSDPDHKVHNYESDEDLNIWLPCETSNLTGANACYMERHQLVAITII